MCKQKNARPNDTVGRRNSIAIFFMAVFLSLLMLSFPILAQDTVIKNEPGAFITYLKKVDDEIYFKVEVQNPDGNRLLLSITDENGDNLYRTSFTDKSYEKNFKTFHRGERLNVLIVNRDSKKVIGCFEIDVMRKMVEEVLVTRM